jgi:hypothetical protein
MGNNNNNIGLTTVAVINSINNNSSSSNSNNNNHKTTTTTTATATRTRQGSRRRNDWAGSVPSGPAMEGGDCRHAQSPWLKSLTGSLLLCQYQSHDYFLLRFSSLHASFIDLCTTTGQSASSFPPWRKEVVECHCHHYHYQSL